MAEKHIIKSKKGRVKWVDVARFFGIFAIYLGHFGNYSGKWYGFVFSYNVALFFFISGCMDYYDDEKNILKYIWKQFKKYNGTIFLV